jgi:hypothetical protein
MSQSFARDMEMAAKIAFTNIENHKPADKKKTIDGERIFSASSWLSWWDGKAKPVPAKVELMDLILPYSSSWFESGKSPFLAEAYWNRMYSDFGTPLEWLAIYNPFQTLLCAMDIFVEQRIDNEPPMLLTQQIVDLWQPRPQISEEEEGGGKQVNGWYVTPLQHLSFSYDLTTHFKFLEPSSIVTFMLWLGHDRSISECDERIFVQWATDLIAAALMSSKIIANYPLELSIMSAGPTADSVALVCWLFFERDLNCSADEARNQIAARIRICNGHKDSKTALIPGGSHFVDLLLNTFQIVQNELNKLDVSLADLKQCIMTKNISEIL